MNISQMCITVLAGWLLLSSLEAKALLLEFRPVNQSVKLGSFVTADLWIDGSDPKSGVGGYDVTVNFNPVFLAFDNVSAGAHFGITAGPFITSTADSISIADISLEPPADLLRLQQSSDFLLGSFRFHTLSSGTSMLDISQAVLGDVNGNQLTVDALRSGNIEVLATAVPEPASYVLLLAGLGLIWVFTKGSRRQNNQSIISAV
jgi:hypothetical protein